MATSHNNVLNIIADSLGQMSKSERKVADVILAEPALATRSSIADLARAADVSEPTVNRFCKKYGAEGYPDFKLKLAQCLASGIRYMTSNVAEGDSTEAYTHKIFDSTINTLALVRDKLCLDLVEQVTEAMVGASRIFFFGLGASSAVATDAEHKFFRFKLPVSSHDDVLMQRMLAASSSPGQLFFIISYTGRTRELVETAAVARESGAKVIGLTAPGSPLAELCDLVIEVNIPEDTDEYMPMTSRIVHLVVLDVLATGFTLRLGAGFQPHLKRIKDSLRPTRYLSDNRSTTGR